MAVFGPVIEAFVGAVLDRRHDLLSGSTIGSQPVGDDAFGRQALLLEQSGQNPLRGFGVAPGLYDLVEYIAILIDRAPQPVSLASDADNDFIEMPDVVRPGRLAAQPAGIVRPELLEVIATDVL